MRRGLCKSVSVPSNKFFFILLLLSFSCGLKSATERFTSGSSQSTALESKDVHILKEVVRIIPDADGISAKFQIEYTIHTDFEGKQIPLLFILSEYKDTRYGNQDSVQVWIDGNAMHVRDIHDDPDKLVGTYFEDFQGSISNESCMARMWSPDSVKEGHFSYESKSFSFKNYLYVKGNLHKGEHIVSVQFRSWLSMLHRPWKERWLAYSLSPAQCRKSEAMLRVIVDNSKYKHPIHVSFGSPTEGKLDSIATWDFKHYPTQDFLLIGYLDALNKQKKTDWLEWDAWIKVPGHVKFLGILTYTWVEVLFWIGLSGGILLFGFVRIRKRHKQKHE